MDAENKWPEIKALIEPFLEDRDKEKHKDNITLAINLIIRDPLSHSYFREYLSRNGILDEKEFDKLIREPSPDFIPLYENHLKLITPVLGFERSLQIALLTTEIPAKKKLVYKEYETFVKVFAPTLITSRGIARECCDFELEKLGLRARTVPSQAMSRWHPMDVRKYVRSMSEGLRPAVMLPRLFDDIRASFADYVYFESPVLYDFMSVYVISTYFYQLFQAFPLLVFLGPKQSGKSLNLQILEHLAFNAMLITDPTPAVIYRAIEELSPTLLLDEIESLASRKEYAGSFMSILRASYKRIDVPRMEEKKEGGFKLKLFHAFGPKVISTIQGVEDVLANRSIIINLIRRRSEDTPFYKNTDPAMEEEKWRELRNQLYLLILTRWKELDALIIPTMRELEHTVTNRELELWTPILSIANWIDRQREDRNRSLFTRLLDMIQEKIKERKLIEKEANQTVLVLQALRALMKDEGEPKWISNYEIKEQLEKFYSEPQGWMNETWIGKLMTQIGVTKSSRRIFKSEFIGEKRLAHYRIDPEWLKDYCERYGVGFSEIEQ